MKFEIYIKAKAYTINLFDDTMNQVQIKLIGVVN